MDRMARHSDEEANDIQGSLHTPISRYKRRYMSILPPLDPFPTLTHAQVSYMILQRVSPVTHSIGNCVKRVVVIVASVFVFQNPVTTQNALGEGGGWPARWG